MVQVLGLGGKMIMDYGEDPRFPVLNVNEEDYLRFEGERREAVYMNAADADVMLCPGDRTHFEIMQREGVPDVTVYHPGLLEAPVGLEDAQRFFVALGVGKIAVPPRLEPGESFSAEFVVRHNKRYWDTPIWDRNAPQPMPPLIPEEDEDEELDNIEADDYDAAGGMQADGPA